MKMVDSSKDLAEKMDRNRSSLSEMMNGNRPVSDKFVRELVALFPALNPDYLLREDCHQMLMEDAEGASIAAGIVNSAKGADTPALNPDQQALVDSYAATIKYLQEHIRKLSDIILRLTTAR